MPTSIKLLDRVAIWTEMRARVATAKRTLAAIAYVGRYGATYLPLKRGDVLVVDMSLAAVRQGATDPREISRLIDRGVAVYTRHSLHAKVVVADHVAFVSSANVSSNAVHYLDEAGIMTSATTATREARRFICSLCSEPVLPQYLQECISEYRPPRFKALRTISKPRKRFHAKLWLVGGLTTFEPRFDRQKLEQITREAEEEIQDKQHSEVTWIRYAAPRRFLKNLRPNDWIIQCYREQGGKRIICPPARVIRKRTYTSSRGKKCHLVLLESPCNGDDISLAEFRRRVHHMAPLIERSVGRTVPVRESSIADKVMRIWTNRGKLSRRRN